MPEHRPLPYAPARLRVGAHGVVIGAHDPGTPEWLAARRGGITATDLPKILGLSPYGNALSVWHDKRGTLPEEPAGEAAAWGNLLEDVVAREWARRRGVRLQRVGTAVDRVEPWRRASLDRIVVGTRRRDALEVKTRSAFVAGRWSTDIPDDVLAQVAWQRAALGLDVVHVAVLLGGQELREFTYERDRDLEDYLIRAATPVWRAVLDGVPPLVDEDAALAAVLDRLHPDRAGTVDVDGPRGAMLVERYRAACDAVKAAEADKAAARASVLLALGAGDVLTADGMRIATYREQTRTGVALARARKEAPQLVAQLEELGLITTTTTRTLRVGTGE